MTKDKREARVDMVAGILRDAIFRRGQNWFRTADEVLGALEAEAEYEYAATWKMGGSAEYYPVFSDEWGTLEEAKADAEYAKTWDMQDAKIMRRLKVGEAEDFDA